MIHRIIRSIITIFLKVVFLLIFFIILTSLNIIFNILKKFNSKKNKQSYFINRSKQRNSMYDQY
jgi:hypothetical protein